MRKTVERVLLPDFFVPIPKENNMYPLRNLLPLIFCLTCSSVMAATSIEVINGNGGRTQVMMDGNQSRLDMGEKEGYVLIDYSKQSMLIVIPEKKQILDMSDDMSSMGGKPAPKVKTELVSNGSGPTIAGYPTIKYILKAEGRVCGTLFGSKEAMQTSGIDKLFESMKTMAEKQRAAMGSYASMIDVCTRANMDFAAQGQKVGVPMRMLDARGKITSEIKSIKTNVNLPANTFDIPQGYQTTTVAEQMQGARQAMSQGQRQMPDMEKMMQQMQQSGRVPPEAMEQMKRYQQMMQEQGR
jgi:hypothetical protein